jgi:uncharacterized protein
MDLTSIAVIDQHAHSLVRSDIMANTPYPAAFSEGYAVDSVNHHARHTLSLFHPSGEEQVK